jgi:endoglucanase
VYGTQSTSTFSNVKPGAYDQTYHYDGQASFNYLASRGIKEVVIPFRWERIQPTLGGALNAAEVKRLKDVITRANNAGIKSVPIVANYGAYWLYDSKSGKGVRRAIGSAYVGKGKLADMWKKLSLELKAHPGISAYGLMREPASLPGSTNRAQAMVWESASQAAVNAIRANGDTQRLLVSGYRFSNAHTWPKQHPKKWIVDPAKNHLYEAHHYWAATYDDGYLSYADEVNKAKAMGY